MSHTQSSTKQPTLHKNSELEKLLRFIWKDLFGKRFNEPSRRVEDLVLEHLGLLEYQKMLEFMRERKFGIKSLYYVPLEHNAPIEIPKNDRKTIAALLLYQYGKKYEEYGGAIYIPSFTNKKN